MMSLTHIHPMLVHFPLVLWPIGTLLLVLAVLNGRALTERTFIVQGAVWSLLIGSVVALLAAAFGDLALDVAKDLGFPEAPLEDHEETVSIAVWLFVVVTAVLGWVHFKSVAVPGWLKPALVVASLVGVGVAIYGAWLGGNLVYELGVNVAAVHP